MSAGHDFQPGAASAATQCARVLARLKKGPASTADLRTLLGLSSSPAARVLTLRASHNIITVRTVVGGAVVAFYVLEGGQP